MRLPLPRSRSGRLGVVAAVFAAAAALVWWRGPTWETLTGAFTAVFWGWVALAIALNLGSVVIRALAWHTVIAQAMPRPRPRFRSVFAAFSVGLLGNAALPGRIGEIARVAVLSRRLRGRDGAWATLLGTVVAHRVFDVLAVSALIVYVIVEAEIPAWAITSLAVFVALGLVALAVSVAGARRHHRPLRPELTPLRRLVTMLRHGLGVMHAPLAASVAAALQCVGWLLQLLAVYAAMRAFRIDEPLVAAALVLVLMNAATIFPLWPGNVGLVQAAVALSLVPYGIAYAHGFAFGIGLQAIEASVGVAFGLLFLAREGFSFAMLRQMPTASEADGAGGGAASLPRLSFRRDNRRARPRVRL